ncbi:hypothetical protein BC939DRAFT_500201 [Gamsiella multidivaricata]|uniref:uncharacterized protein n=1 Tax=Gamsiella multidivaricata TaxID=101098 RepID=UPI002220AA4A|nr:uncharacterized protein BC939DRAFT_500201 [Gamsiella multidivaricata]KAG0364478.1 hypothetical protein BGZ54_007448 [Gamsiella multidivaricata]KAI7829350.1 hypothetical protein BC939DRAFT_500201 [Gamsiella multidivaricata]
MAHTLDHPGFHTPCLTFDQDASQTVADDQVSHSTNATEKYHEVQYNFLAENAPFESAIRCAAMFYKQFHFAGPWDGRDALRKTLRSLEQSGNKDFAGFDKQIESDSFKEWERDYFDMVRTSKKSIMDGFLTWQKQQAQRASISEGKKVLLTRISLVSNLASEANKAAEKEMLDSSDQEISTASGSNSLPSEYSVRQQQTEDPTVPEPVSVAPSTLSSLSSSSSSLTVSPPESPFIDEKSKHPDVEVDVVSIAEVGAIFKIKLFDFTGCLGDMNVGRDFNKYFTRSAELKYNKDSFPDFLAINGILFLRDRPTKLQEECFKQRYHKILEVMKGYIPEPADDTVEEALSSVRRWKDTYEFKFRKVRDVGVARRALQEAVEGAKTSSWK